LEKRLVQYQALFVVRCSFFSFFYACRYHHSFRQINDKNGECVERKRYFKSLGPVFLILK
jgi:hypothetical protein